jgi:hypothetical protein
MSSNAGAARNRWQFLLKFISLIILIIAANFVAHWAVDALNFELRPSNEDMVHRAIMVSAIVYAILLAIPFVPGMEVGLALIGMLGPPIVFLVYLCTLAGLSLSFVVGRLVPLDSLIKPLEDFRFRRTETLLRTIKPMNMEDRLAFLLSKAPNRFVPILLRHRYIALAIALNLPGNFLIGGGGGIALMAGVSGLYSTPGFLVTIALAVSPLPLAILLFGNGILSI